MYFICRSLQKMPMLTPVKLKWSSFTIMWLLGVSKEEGYQHC